MLILYSTVYNCSGSPQPVTCFAELLRHVKRDTVTVAHGGVRDKFSGKVNVRPLCILTSFTLPCGPLLLWQLDRISGTSGYGGACDRLPFDHVNAYQPIARLEHCHSWAQCWMQKSKLLIESAAKHIGGWWMPICRNTYIALRGQKDSDSSTASGTPHVHLLQQAGLSTWNHVPVISLFLVWGVVSADHSGARQNGIM